MGMGFSRSLFGRFLDPLAASTGKLVGALGALAGTAHLTGWTLTTSATWPDALAAGEVGSAAGELGAYAASHPAYVGLALVGLALVVFAE
jgi:hypothetical protein